MPQAVAAFFTWLAGGTAGANLAAFAIKVWTVVSTAVIIGAVSKALFGPKPSETIVSRMQMSRDPVPNRRIVYGTLRLSGPMIHAEASPSIVMSGGSPAPEDGGKNKFLTYLVALAAHEVRDIRDIRLNNEPLDLVIDGFDSNGYPRYVPNAGNRYEDKVRVKIYYGTDDQPADSDFIYDTQFNTEGKWDSTKRCQGVAYVVCRIEYDQEVFSSGWPNLTAMVDGRLIYEDYTREVSAVDAGSDTITTTPEHWMPDGAKVTFTNEGGSLPGGINAGQAYYLRDVTSSTFKLSASKLDFELGNVLDITSSGSGTTTMVTVGIFNRNPARILSDYLTSSRLIGGIGESWSRIDKDVLNVNAGICWENVHRGGVEVSRYFCDCIAEAGEDPVGVIQRILTSMSGTITTVNGKWWIRAGIYRAPTDQIDEDDLIGGIEVLPNGPYSNTANAVRGVYAGPANDYFPLRMPEANFWTDQAVASVDHDANTITVASPNIFEDGDRVITYAWPTGVIPGGLNNDVFYYVINRTDTTFQVSLTEDGPAVDLLDNGSGDLHFSRDPYLTEDGERIYYEVEYDSVTDPYLAQHLALIDLRKMRNDFSINIKARIRYWDSVVGDTLRLLNGAYGLWEETEDTGTLTFEDDGECGSAGHGLSDGDAIILTSSGNLPAPLQTSRLYRIRNATTDTFELVYYRSSREIIVATGAGTGTHTWRRVIGKLFEVNGIEMFIENEPAIMGVNLQLRETFASIYDYTYGFVPAIDLAPNTELPDPRIVDTPENLQVETGTNALYLKSDGTVISRAHLTWDLVDDYFVVNGGTIQVEYKKSADSDWLFGAYLFGSSTEHYITDVEDGVDYDFRIRAANFSAGARSEWATVTDIEIIGKTAPPGDVTDFGASNQIGGVEISWNNPSDLDLSHVNIYRSYWPGGIGPFLPYEFLARVNAPTERYFDTKPYNRPVYFWIETVDTSGNKGTLTEYNNSSAGWYPIVPAMHTDRTAKRQAYPVTSVNAGTDTITINSFDSLDTKRCVFRSANGSYPAGISPEQFYWLSHDGDPDQFELFTDSGLSNQFTFTNTVGSAGQCDVIIDDCQFRRISSINTGGNYMIITPEPARGDFYVRFSSTGSLPGGISSGTTYSLRAPIGGGDDEYQVYSLAGSLINITSAGSGTITATSRRLFLGWTPTISVFLALTNMSWCGDSNAGSPLLPNYPPAPGQRVPRAQDPSWIRHYGWVEDWFTFNFDFNKGVWLQITDTTAHTRSVQVYTTD